MKFRFTALLPIFLYFAILNLVVPAAAQSTTISTFSKEFYPALAGATRSLAVDLNNDGTPDLVTVNERTNLIAVQLSDGTGHFGSKIDWAVNHGFNGIVTMATGDLNQDGNADVMLSDGLKEVSIFFGDGHGGYCLSCASITTTFSVSAVQVADFNHDGHPDIAAAGSNAAGQATMAIFYGNGTTQFTAPSFVNLSPTNVDPISDLVTGDFDGDTNADLVFTGRGSCDRANQCITPFGVLYGDGKGGFAEAPTRTFNFAMRIGSYDVNRDGHSDVVFSSYCAAQCATGIGVAYGLSDRTFLIKQSATPGFSPGPAAPIAGDFNGDGVVDLALQAEAQSSPFDDGILIAQADASYGSWKNQNFQDLGSQTFPNRPVTADWNRDLKPDLLTVESFPQPSSKPAQIVEFLNTSASGAFPRCVYPSTPTGINVCTPGNGVTGNSTVHFTAAVNSFSPVRKLEVWVDGVKIKEAFKTWMDFYANVATGNHQAVFFSAGYDNALQAQVVDFQVSTGDPCPIPSSSGLNVCSPINGLTTGSPVFVLARGNINRFVARMEVWVDGVKMFSTFNSHTLQTSLALNPGTHRFGFYVVSTNGDKRSKLVTTTVR